MAQLRPRFAYRIDDVDKRAGHARTLGEAEVYNYVFTVTKVVIKDVPETAVVHGWKWDPRTKRGQAWSRAA